MKLATIALLLLATAAVAGEEKTVLERLKSDSAAERAWGAHLAGKDGVTDAVPLLVDLIRTVPKYDDKEALFVARAAFDALIRLKAPVKPDVLAPHLGGYFRTQALILITRSPMPRPDILLKVFDRQGTKMIGPFGVAVGNLLCQAKAPGFARRLLRHFQKFKLYVQILDEGFGGRVGRGSRGLSFGDGRMDVPEGFPPTALYHLSDRPKAGSELLADGPRPIRWYRTERTARRFGVGSSSQRTEFADLAREWLAVLSGSPEKRVSLRITRSTSLIWTDEKAYVKQVARERDAIIAHYWKLVATLITKDALALDEARTLKPVVEVEVTDKRKKPAPAGTEFPKLPTPPKRPRLPGEPPEER